MGSQLIHLLRNPIVKARFEEIIGTEILDSFVVKQKKEFSGRKFKIYLGLRKLSILKSMVTSLYESKK
ncbi:hypothetical protein [Acinetobacter indicus]|uniref:hypothetical protein n=1 Tax=Acinetobacter indicus TaxID=756892 RepID=UPI001D0D898A|nr:hypothetical protein [Acinetobacter indicus]